jgi:hypothetical protein
LRVKSPTYVIERPLYFSTSAPQCVSRSEWVPKNSSSNVLEHEQRAQSRVQPRPSCAEDEGRDPVGMIGCQHLRNGAAGRMSDQMHLVETQVIDEPQRVRGPLLYFVGRLALARAHPTMIEGHDLECRGKGGDLCRPVGTAFAKARHEHDGCTCAGNVIRQRSAIGCNHQHCHVASRLGWVDKNMVKRCFQPTRICPRTSLWLMARHAGRAAYAIAVSDCSPAATIDLFFAVADDTHDDHIDHAVWFGSVLPLRMDVQVRASGQPQDREGARPRRALVPATARRRGDRMKCSTRRRRPK